MAGYETVARKYMTHDMIEKHTSLPDYPELRTRLFRAFLNQGFRTSSGEAKGTEAIALAVSLAQLGLDTHELVDGNGETRKRQMTVLAGDYFSSRFYQALSLTEDVRSISLISQSICEVNRMKMNLYSSAKKLLITAEQYVREMVEVRSHLYLAFTSWMDEVCRKAWPALLRTVSECELIAAELGRDRPDNVKHSWAFWYVIQHGTNEEVQGLVSGTLDAERLAALWKKYEIRFQLFRMCDEKLEEMKKLIAACRSDGVPDELLQLVEPLFQGARQQAKVLEEI